MDEPSDMPLPLPEFLPSAPSAWVDEPARKVGVLAECDVAVFGGGPAGVCAAAAAARAGQSVVLVERYGFLGGMATAANVNGWDSLYGMDRATRIIGGLPLEVIRRLQHRGAARNLADDGETGQWIIESETTKLVYDDLVIASGAKLLLHTWLAGVLVEQGRVTAALVESKSGRHAIRARVFIDCTGDADVVRRAGLPTQHGDGQGHCQPPTLCFRLGGVTTPRTPMPDIQADLSGRAMDYNGETYPCQLWGRPSVFDPTEWMIAGTRVLGIDAADVRSFTRGEIESRYQMRWVLKHLRTVPGFREAWLVDIATQLGVRETHRIEADLQVSRRDILQGRAFDDAIAQGTWPIDIHNPRGGGTRLEYLDGTVKTIEPDGSRSLGRWDGAEPDAPRRETLCWQVPYRALIPRGLENVLAAGRCIGADHEAAGAIRVMINAMQFGQAAGVAAALAPASGEVRAVDPRRLVETLRGEGVPLNPVSSTRGR